MRDRSNVRLVLAAAGVSLVLLAAACAPPTPPVTPPSLTGTPIVGATLSVQPGSASVSPSSHDYRWESCAQASRAGCSTVGGNSAQYVVQPADVGRWIGAVLTRKTGGGQPPVLVPVVGPVTNPGGLRITTQSLGTAVVGTWFDLNLTASVESLDLEWSSTTDLPPGLEISSFGRLFGSPTTPGTYTVGLVVSNETNSAAVSLPLTVRASSANAPVPLTFSEGAASLDLALPPGASVTSSVALGTRSGLDIEVCGDEGAPPTVTVLRSNGTVLGSSTPSAVEGCVGIQPRYYATAQWAASLAAGTYRIVVTNPMLAAAVAPNGADSTVRRLALSVQIETAGIQASPIPPNPVSLDLDNAIDIAAGYEHSCAVLEGGSVRCWGSNGFGQLGDGTRTNSRFPVAVQGLTGVTQVSAGNAHSCALLAGGTVKCWGWNGSGQLGNGTNTASWAPVDVQGLTGVTHLAAGAGHTCALLENQTVKCWGWNYFSQLGSGGFANSLVPAEVASLDEVEQISLSANGSCALIGPAGEVRCWGQFEHVGVPYTGLSGATRIAAGWNHSCAMLTGRTVECWGRNAYGQLGNGTTTNSAEPVQVVGLTEVIQIVVASGDSESSCALLEGGSVECWGWNPTGQLGNGTTSSSSTPAPVEGLAEVAQVASGKRHTCARIRSGEVNCWGWNFYGQLGDGTTTDSSIPVSVSASRDTIEGVAGDLKPECGPVVGARGERAPGSPGLFFQGEYGGNPGGVLRDLTGEASGSLATALSDFITREMVEDLAAEFQSNSKPNPFAEGLKVGSIELVDRILSIFPVTAALYGLGAATEQGLTSYRATVDQVATNEYYSEAQYAPAVTDPLFMITGNDVLQLSLASVILTNFVARYGRCPSIFDGSFTPDGTEDKAKFRGELYRMWFPGAVDLVESRSPDWVRTFADPPCRAAGQGGNGSVSCSKAPPSLADDVIEPFFHLLRRIRKDDGRGLRFAEADWRYSYEGASVDSSRAIILFDPSGEDMVPVAIQSYPNLGLPGFSSKDIIDQRLPVDAAKSRRYPEREWTRGVQELALKGSAPLGPQHWPASIAGDFFPGRSAPSQVTSARVLYSPTFTLDHVNENPVPVGGGVSVLIEADNAPYFWVISEGTPLRDPSLNAQLNRPGYRYPMVGN